MSAGGTRVYARRAVYAFAVVIALLAIAALGWLLSRAARAALRRRGLPTDEHEVADVSRPIWQGGDDAGAGGAAGDTTPGGPVEEETPGS